MSTQPHSRVDSRLLLGVVALAIVAWLVVSGDLLSRDSLILLAVLFPSVILHEVSHGAVAYVFGDPTARDAGRLTLNPLRHIDPFGTVILPAMLVLAGAPAFGYAKPVPVNVRRLRNPRDHGLLVSLAGPATNLVLVVAATIALRVSRPHGTVAEVLFALGYINVVLAIFNMIPLPPLDGSALVERVLPDQWWPGWLRLRQYSMGILLLILLVLPARYGLSRVINPAVRFWVTTFLR